MKETYPSAAPGGHLCFVSLGLMDQAEREVVVRRELFDKTGIVSEVDTFDTEKNISDETRLRYLQNRYYSFPFEYHGFRGVKNAAD